MFAVAALYLLVAGLASVFTMQEATPPAYPFGNAKPISILAALFQAGLFGVTGWAILRKRKFAIKLVWAGTTLAAIGVIFRGLILLDTLVWLVSLALAIWYTKAPLLSDHQERQLIERHAATSLQSAAGTTVAVQQTAGNGSPQNHSPEPSVPMRQPPPADAPKSVREKAVQAAKLFIILLCVAAIAVVILTIADNHHGNAPPTTSAASSTTSSEALGPKVSVPYELVDGTPVIHVKLCDGECRTANLAVGTSAGFDFLYTRDQKAEVFHSYQVVFADGHFTHKVFLMRPDEFGYRKGYLLKYDEFGHRMDAPSVTWEGELGGFFLKDFRRVTLDNQRHMLYLMQ
jgi:hypothetical protein